MDKVICLYTGNPVWDGTRWTNDSPGDMGCWYQGAEVSWDRNLPNAFRHTNKCTLDEVISNLRRLYAAPYFQLQVIDADQCADSGWEM